MLFQTGFTPEDGGAGKLPALISTPSECQVLLVESVQFIVVVEPTDCFREPAPLILFSAVPANKLHCDVCKVAGVTVTVDEPTLIQTLSNNISSAEVKPVNVVITLFETPEPEGVAPVELV